MMVHFCVFAVFMVLIGPAVYLCSGWLSGTRSPSQPRCRHDRVGDEVFREGESSDGIQTRYVEYRVCLDCGEKARRCTVHDFVRTPEVEAAFDAANRIILEVRPRFWETAGSGLRISFPPAIARSYLTGGEDAARRTAISLFNCKPSELGVMFE